MDQAVIKRVILLAYVGMLHARDGLVKVCTVYIYMIMKFKRKNTGGESKIVQHIHG